MKENIYVPVLNGNETLMKSHFKQTEKAHIMENENGPANTFQSVF